MGLRNKVKKRVDCSKLQSNSVIFGTDIIIVKNNDRSSLYSVIGTWDGKVYLAPYPICHEHCVIITDLLDYQLNYTLHEKFQLFV